MEVEAKLALSAPIMPEQVEAVDWAPYLNSKWTDAADTHVPLAELQRQRAVQALLGFTGVSSHVRYGVGRDANGGFRAHAWVECDGRVIIGGGEDMNGLVALSAQQC